ncbi:hypothetical protein NDU88_009867, partial [Pleurodeles waltl]
SSSKRATPISGHVPKVRRNTETSMSSAPEVQPPTVAPAPRASGSLSAIQDTSIPDLEQAFSEDSTPATTDDQEPASPSGLSGQTAP